MVGLLALRGASWGLTKAEFIRACPRNISFGLSVGVRRGQGFPGANPATGHGARTEA
jgi:hypothetical protein